jgi:hypothetical protein
VIQSALADTLANDVSHAHASPRQGASSDKKTDSVLSLAPGLPPRAATFRPFRAPDFTAMPFAAREASRPPGDEHMNGPARSFRAKLHVSFSATLINVASLALLFALTCAASARAQDLDDVSFSGTVVDVNGAVLRGATVTARLPATGAGRAATTDEGGRYRLFELPPGTYTLRAECVGFAAGERREVSVVAGQALRIDFKLSPAGVSAEQTVLSDASAPAVDTTRTVNGGTLAREEVERLPVFTRSPLDLVFLLGGVTEEPLSTRDAAEDRDPSSRSSAERAAAAPEEAGTFALAGGPAYSNNVTVDGLDNNDDRAARERFTPPLDAVEEVQVITNQFSAEYGRLWERWEGGEGKPSRPVRC